MSVIVFMGINVINTYNNNNNKLMIGLMISSNKIRK